MTTAPRPTGSADASIARSFVSSTGRGSGRCCTVPALGAGGGRLQVRGALVVWPDGRCRSVPYGAVGLTHEHSRQRSVSGLTLGDTGRLVDRRANERMTKANRCTVGL